MLELGAHEAEGHCRVGRRAVDVVSLLITVGERGRLIGESAIEHGMTPERVIHVADNVAAVSRLRQLIHAGDVILIKGSRGMAMEEIVHALARSSADADANGGSKDN
jgi:UDP-N-acetylmuramoyl-tripeptide--D-alanyl-D-alanine ligase